MSDIYYQITDGTNTLTFVMESLNISKTRDIWEQPLPYVADPFLTDQITTASEITVNAKIKPASSGMPYTTVILAIAALDGITSSTYSTGFSLQGGDWNGSTFTPNAAYFALGTGTTKLLVTMVRYTLNKGESYLTGEIDAIITLKQGQVF